MFQFQIQAKHSVKRFVIPLVFFLVIALFLTLNVISLPSLVIGDNFRWTPNNIIDIIGPKIIRESYLGDIAIQSTFKTGFLFPLTYLLVALNFPSTIVYPFLFYFLAMFSFYFLSKEFVKNEGLRILASVLYLINPVTPYYYASIINAFSLVLLPLGLKFFIRSLRDVQIQKKPRVLRNIGFTAFFLSLTVSANEQIIFSIALVTLFFTLTFMIESYKKYRLTGNFLKVCISNFIIFGLVCLFVDAPLIVSFSNVQSAPLATYFQGPSSARFIQTIGFTYTHADVSTLLRLGGDSGSGLGVHAWYDSNIFTNYFGYFLFAFFVLSIIILFLNKNRLKSDSLFFCQTILLFGAALTLILLMQSLSAGLISNGSLALILKTWETPAKLRVIMLVSILATILLVFRMVDFIYSKKKKNFLIGLTLTVLISTTLIYNSPWLINYAGQTTLQEVSDSAKWGGLYNQTYVDAANKLEQESQGARGIILPFTHKAELYSDPNTRIFQIVSSVNDASSTLLSEENFPWSKGLGLFSINSVAIMNSYNSNDGLIFPKTIAYDMNYTIAQIRNDTNLKLLDESQYSDLYYNQNALPLLYASNNYIIYDNVGTLKYAFDFTNFSDLPIFLNQAETISQLNVPSFINQGKYELHALNLPNENTTSLALNITNSGNSRTLQLGKGSLEGLNDFSCLTTLSAEDVVQVIEPKTAQTRQISDITINSTTVPIGTYGSFTLDFKVNILKNGNSTFLSPRILLDTGNELYFIILHDNGNLELAIERNGVFYSAVIYQYVGYSLRDPNSQINVKVIRVIDRVDVYVNSNLYMTFPITPKTADISLVSEQSTSHFSEINITQSDPVRLFALRQDYTKIPFKIEKDNSEESSLTVSTNETDFAVVSQYLYNNLKNVQNNLSTSSFRANIFFKGWIFKPQILTEQTISIGIQGQELTYCLILLSIIFTGCMLLFLIEPSIYVRIVNGFNSRTKRKKENDK